MYHIRIVKYFFNFSKAYRTTIKNLNKNVYGKNRFFFFLIFNETRTVRVNISGKKVLFGFKTNNAENRKQRGKCRGDFAAVVAVSFSSKY